ncbi:unnamed protein product, partial [Ectocarpus sp. 8 AP-2014]
MTGVLYTGESTSAVHKTDISSGHSLDPNPICSSCAAARAPRARVATNVRPGALQPIAPNDKPGVTLCSSKQSAQVCPPVACCCCRRHGRLNHLSASCWVRKLNTEHTPGGHTAATPYYICVELVPCIYAERERQGRWVCLCLSPLPT